MKKYRSSGINRTILAVPMAALMLGAAEASSTVGLNFQQYYYDSATIPQTLGFNPGYSDYATTGFPVTAKAFGVDVADWSNTDPIGPRSWSGTSSILNQDCKFGGTDTTFAGGLSCQVTAPEGTYSSGAGGLIPVSNAYNYPTNYPVTLWTPPGDTEALWGNIVATDANPFSVTVTGLAAKFPAGYMIQSVAGLGANGGVQFPLLPSVDFTDGATSSTAAYHIRYVQNNPGCQWTTTTVGVSDPSPVFTGNTITISSRADGTGIQSTLAGVIISDKPVVTSCTPATSTVISGDSFTLTGTAIGIGTLSYQWKHDGVDVGTDSPTYTVATSSGADGGNYTLTVTSSSFPGEPATSEIVSVTIVVPAAVTWDADNGAPGIQDGSGTWDTTTANWWDGSSDLVWSSLNPVTFGNGGAGPYTVTLAESVTSGGGITFDSGNYTLAPTEAEKLTLEASTVITTAADGTIAVNLAGSTGYTKTGAGILTLSGANNSIAGAVIVNEGTVNLGWRAGGSSLTVNPGATVITTSTNAIGYNTSCYTLNVNGGTFTLGALNDGVWAMDTTLNDATMTAITGSRYSFGGGSQISNTGTSSFTGGSLVLREGNVDNTLPITNTGDLTFNCPITGGGNISFTGAGTTTLAGSNTYGSTTVNGGTLVVSGTVNGAVTVNAGSLEVSGTVNAGFSNVFLGDDTTLSVTSGGGITTTGELLVGNYDNPGVGANTANFAGLNSTTVAPVTGGTLYIDKPLTINILSVLPAVGQYPLFVGTGSALVDDPEFVITGTLPAGIDGTIVDDTAGDTQSIYLDVTAVNIPAVAWTGDVAGGVWDIDTTANWTPTNYQEGNVVTFDDTATGTTDVVLNTTVNPTTVTFNNDTLDYTLSGSGAIAGSAALIKSGAAMATISTSNTFSGGTTVQDGTLVLMDTTSGSIVNASVLEISASAGPLTYNTSITGTGTLIKSGADKLTITGGLALTAATTVTEGTLEVQTRAGDAPYVVESIGTLMIGYSTGGGYANTNLKLYGDGVAATTGLYLAGGKSYNVSGTLELLDAPTTIRQYGTGLASFGIFDINSTGLLCNAAASGSATDASVRFYNGGYGMSAQIDAGTETATGDFTLNGPLDVDSTNFGFYKRGAGSMRLNSPATANNKGVKIHGGSIICGVADCIGTNAVLQINSGSMLNLNGFNQTVASLYFGTSQQVSGTWGADGSGAQHIDDTRFSGSGMVTVITGPPGYSAWAAANAPGQDLSQDHDNDGVTNGVEYFMGESGSGFTANPGVVGGMVSWPKGGTYLGVYGTDYVVQTSPDLSTWTPVASDDPNLGNGSPVQYTLPTDDPKLFVRLMVTGP